MEVLLRVVPTSRITPLMPHFCRSLIKLVLLSWNPIPESEYAVVFILHSLIPQLSVSQTVTSVDDSLATRPATSFLLPSRGHPISFTSQQLEVLSVLREDYFFLR